MPSLNMEELVGGLLEAGMVAQRIAEKQHINNIVNYFNDDGTPKSRMFRVGDKDIEIPYYILADHSSLGLEELDIEFDARLVIGYKYDYEYDSIVKNKNDDYQHNIKSIEVDSGKNNDGSGMAKIKVKFKSDTKPEMISRLVDSYIQRLEDTSTSSK